MQFVTVCEVMDSIGSQIDVSESERATTLRLSDEVAQIRDAQAPSPFSGKTMGDLREEIIAGLARSFARAYKLSMSAALLENALHHEEESQPRLFDLRQTGLPRISTSAIAELRPILFGVAQFECRLVQALSTGRLRNFPRHGGPRAIGVNPDDWKSNPNDGETLKKLIFVREEIQRTLRDTGIRFRPMRDAFTNQVVAEDGPAAELPELAGSNMPVAIKGATGITEQTIREPIKQRWDQLGSILVRALKEAVRKGTPVNPKLCAAEAFTIISLWIDKNELLGVLDFGPGGAIHYRGKPLKRRSVQARVTRMWDCIQPLLQDEEAAMTNSRLHHGRTST